MAVEWKVRDERGLSNDIWRKIVDAWFGDMTVPDSLESYVLNTCYGVVAVNYDEARIVSLIFQNEKDLSWFLLKHS